MTRADFQALVDDALGECELHASYSLSKAKFEGVRIACQAIRLGVRERLEDRSYKPPRRTHVARVGSTGC